MNGFVATPDDREDVVPFTLDVRAIGVQLMREAGVADDFLTGDDVFGKRYSDADGDDTKIYEDFHGNWPNCTRREYSGCQGIAGIQV